MQYNKQLQYKNIIEFIIKFIAMNMVNNLIVRTAKIILIYTIIYSCILDQHTYF